MAKTTIAMADNDDDPVGGIFPWDEIATYAPDSPLMTEIRKDEAALDALLLAVAWWDSTVDVDKTEAGQKLHDAAQQVLARFGRGNAGSGAGSGAIII